MAVTIILTSVEGDNGSLTKGGSDLPSSVAIYPSEPRPPKYVTEVQVKCAIGSRARQTGVESSCAHATCLSGLA